MESQATPSWLSFHSWLEQQRGEAANLSGEDVDVESSPQEPNEASARSSPAASSDTSSDGNSSRNTERNPAAPQVPTVPPRQGTNNRPPLTASLARDCRMETRLVDGCARARQEMTIILAAPGMPLHKSPLVTTKQAKSLLSALYEPLVQVSVGRLTRRLESPTILSPTEDRGTLGLWLLPNDDLSLVWQGRAAEPKEAGNADMHPLVRGLGRRTYCDVQRCVVQVAVWEELARFPASTHAEHDDPLITIHMLRGDRSGRSFYIKPRDDIPTGPPNAFSDAQGLSSFPGDADPSSSGGARRIYFWLTEKDINSAIYNLGRLKSLVKRPPTLAKRSGVSPSQIRDIGAWMQQLGPAQIHAGDVPVGVAPTHNPSSSGTSSAFSTGEMLSRHAPPSTCRMFTLEDDNLAAVSTVSATAAAVYRDRRLQVACPCHISVGATVVLQGHRVGDATVDDASADLMRGSTTRAKGFAEEAARRTVDRLGRQRVEELVCESLMQSVRSQRAQAKADRQHRREQQRRQRLAADAEPLIRRAVEHAALHTGSSPRSCKLSLQLATLSAATARGATTVEEEDPLRWAEGSGGSSEVGSSSGGGPDSPSESAHRPPRRSSPAGSTAEDDTTASSSTQCGRVTIDNLHSLLKSASLESLEPRESAGAEHVAPASARSVSGKVTLADLGDLLHPK